MSADTNPYISTRSRIHNHRFLLVFVAAISFVFIVLFISVEHSAENCDLLTIHHECDISGWLALIVGDVVCGMVLALLFHYISMHSNKKIDEARFQINQIIIEQKKLRDRRETYVIQALKNHFSSLLLCIGIINRFANSDNEKQRQIADAKTHDLVQILQKGQAVLGVSIDVLDPMLVENIEKLFTSIEKAVITGKSNGGTDIDLVEIKTTIKNLTANLDDYEHSHNIIK